MRHGATECRRSWRRRIMEHLERPSRTINEIYLALDFKLIYIAKAHRGRGLGQMLSAAICVWLDHCKLSGVHVAKRGISVLFYSEYGSGGGVKCGDIIRDHFIYMQECRREFGARDAGWRIREFIDEVGL
jgi:GNAT superfamily N-acetyltransferase